MDWLRFSNPIARPQLTDLEWKLLVDLERPHRQRKIVPLGGLVADRKLEEMRERGWTRWVQVDPIYTSLGADHYELTDAGRKVLAGYREWVRQLGKPRSANPAFQPGETVWMAHPDDIERLTIIERGTGDYNVKDWVRRADPYVVRSESGPDKGAEGVYPSRDMFSSELAAAVRSAEIQRELEEEDR